METYTRIATCRLLMKIKENPEYSKTLGLVESSIIRYRVMLDKERKGEAQIDDIADKKIFGQNG